MLILGKKYNFTTLEIERLNKKFNNIDKIIYKDRDAKEVIADIESVLEKTSFTLILLNTKVKVDDEIIKYLTNLKFQEKYKNIKIISIEHFLEKYLHKCYIPEDNSDLHYLDDIQGFTFFQRVQKKIVDFIAIFFLFIIFVFVKYIVNKKTQQESPGDLYFKQLRVGLHNKEFNCTKFRSMNLDAEKDGVQFASQNDTRVFAWGEFIRKTRVDEIPQVLNIIKGEMSIIGPRPERKYWIEKDFEKHIPYYNYRHIVKPGITGWAQVMYPYGANIEDARQKLMYDLYYIKYWSLWLEIKIVYKTVLVVLNKQGV